MHPPRGVSSHGVISLDFIRFPAGAGEVDSPCSSLVVPTVAFSIGFTSIRRVGDTYGTCITK